MIRSNTGLANGDKGTLAPMVPSALKFYCTVNPAYCRFKFVVWRQVNTPMVLSYFYARLVVTGGNKLYTAGTVGGVGNQLNAGAVALTANSTCDAGVGGPGESWTKSAGNPFPGLVAVSVCNVNVTYNFDRGTGHS